MTEFTEQDGTKTDVASAGQAERCVMRLPDESAFFTMSISIPWWKNFIKKLKMKDWWLRRPRYNCPRCNKGMYTYWDGNDIEGHGIDYCNKCAKELDA